MAAKPELFDHIFHSIALVHTIADQSKVLKDDEYSELCINCLELMRSSTLFKDGYRDMLLKLAGREPKNYLRSMFDSGFFEANPQEFVASIANEYCSSSQHTFLYAMKKYTEGNLNQINQFVIRFTIEP